MTSSKRKVVSINNVFNFINENKSECFSFEFYMNTPEESADTHIYVSTYGGKGWKSLKGWLSSKVFIINLSNLEN